jgi:hypothetical protein
MEVSPAPIRSKQGRSITFFRMALAILGLLTVMLGAWLYSNQHRHIESLDRNVAQIKAANKSLTKADSTLKSKNTNLAKAVKLLQSQINQSTSQSANNLGTSSETTSTAPSPAGSMQVTSVEDSTLSRTPPSGQTEPTTVDVIEVDVTLHNLTNSDQSYTPNQFGAITDAGTVVSTYGWPPDLTGTPWISTTLIPGASLNEALYFNVGQNLVTLTWQAPGGSTPIEASLPAVQQ